MSKSDFHLLVEFMTKLTELTEDKLVYKFLVDFHNKHSINEYIEVIYESIKGNVETRTVHIEGNQAIKQITGFIYSKDTDALIAYKKHHGEYPPKFLFYFNQWLLERG